MKYIIIAVACFVSMLPSTAQKYYNTTPLGVDLEIQSFSQDTPIWCWVAVAQQVVEWATGTYVEQCEMVYAANDYGGPDCCYNRNNRSCMRTGSIYETQALISYYSGSASSIAPPTDPSTLYSVLRQGRAVIMQIRPNYRSAVGHVIVVRGMEWTPYGPVLLINDPMSRYTQPVPFDNLLRMWEAAIVVH